MNFSNRYQISSKQGIGASHHRQREQHPPMTQFAAMALAQQRTIQPPVAAFVVRAGTANCVDQVEHSSIFRRLAQSCPVSKISITQLIPIVQPLSRNVRSSRNAETAPRRSRYGSPPARRGTLRALGGALVNHDARSRRGDGRD